MKNLSWTVVIGAIKDVVSKIRWSYFVLSLASLIAVGAVVSIRSCGTDVIDNEVAVIPLANSDKRSRRADVVFIHGLDGHYRETWETVNEPKFYFPEHLAKEEAFRDVGFWTVKYAAHSSDWYGGSMPIQDRAVNLLELFRLKGIGDKPVVFVTHSLGGLVAKQVIVSSANMNKEEWAGLSKNTKGVVFLATPHAGSSISNYLIKLAKYLPGLKAYRTSVQTEQLKRNSEMLRELGNLYKGVANKLRIATLAFFENERTAGSLLVVDQDSADPGMTDVITTPVDADHGTICKPTSPESLVYLSVADFLKKKLAPPPRPINMTLGDFLTQYIHAKKMGADALKTFEDDYTDKGGKPAKQVTWEVFVKSVNPTRDGEDPFLFVAMDATDEEQNLLARFRHDNFPASLKVGTKVLISGVVTDVTKNGIALGDCKLVKVLQSSTVD